MKRKLLITQNDIRRGATLTLDDDLSWVWWLIWSVNFSSQLTLKIHLRLGKKFSASELVRACKIKFNVCFRNRKNISFSYIAASLEMDTQSYVISWSKTRQLIIVIVTLSFGLNFRTYCFIM